MFDSVLIANRGEIAVRIIRTLRQLGIRSIAVYSDADAGSRHVREADEAIRIGPAPAAESYLDIDAVLRATLATGAAAIHPGYGFLSENPKFARACARAGIRFIGPPVSAIEQMGDKIAAKTRVAAAGVPVVPGRHDDNMTDADVAAAVAEIGYPALLKPSAGGGGKGMKVVRAGADVHAVVQAARREARKAFGDDRLLVERYIERPRHIEVQVLADIHATVLHLGERECSLQRRHQKVVEEAPSPFVSTALRARLGDAAIEAARSCGYVGAGTVEFIVDGKDPDSFFFLEMNTRLQVEHPVTELVTGWDLVAWQIRIAAGEPLPDEPVELWGHAIEARVYAEDPARDFLPSSGTLHLVREPDGVRVDSGVTTGQVVTAHYDPMLAKVIAHGVTREQALVRLGFALQETAYLGVTTNTGFLGRLLQVAEVVSGDLHTGLIDEHPGVAAGPAPCDHATVAAALEWALRRLPGPGADPWTIPDGWRPSGRAGSALRLRRADGTSVDAVVTGLPHDCVVAVGAGHPVACGAEWRDGRLHVTVAGDSRDYDVARDGAQVWLAHRGVVDRFVETDRLDAETMAAAAATLGAVRSPMPGTVIAVTAAVGDSVVAGAPLVTVEAMKMEHTLVAPADAVVTAVPVLPGSQVAMDQVLVALAAPQEA